MKIREKLKLWARQSGVLGALSRLILFFVIMEAYAVVWALVFYFSTFLMWRVIPSQELPEKMFIFIVFLMGALALPTFHVTCLVTQRLEQRPLSSVGLHWSPHIFKEFSAGMVLGSILPIIGFLWYYVEGALQVTWKPASLNIELLGWIILMIVGLLGVAFWEELFFRGYLLQTLATSIGLVPAVLVSCLLFGAIHVGTYGMKPGAILSTALLGFVLTVLYLRTKSLWAPIGMHFMNNFLVFHVLSVPITDLKFPLIKVNGQPLKLEPLSMFFQTKLTEGKDVIYLVTWENLVWSLIFYGVLALVIWRLPWFRAQPEMEALWRQYVPIAQPWAQLKSWWAKRRNQHPKDAS